MINWKVRYGNVLALLPELRDTAVTVLEVGAGGSGIRNYLCRSVVSVDLDYALAHKAGSLGITANATRLPFADESFDLVLCLDTLEHIAPARRALAIKELTRVSGKKLVIGMPMGAFAAWGDGQYFQFLQSRNVPTPSWLVEHLTIGIPSLGSILRGITDIDLGFRIHGNETLIQHYAGLLADEVRFLNQANMALEAKHADAPPIAPGIGDVYYSYLVEIDKCGASTSRHVATVSSAPSMVKAPGHISLFCVGHDPARMLPLAGHKRFFVGKTAPADCQADADFYCDDQAHSIRERNPTYSELTAIYSVWKNARHGDHVGFCHYRRFFNFLGRDAATRNNVIASRDAFEQARPAMESIESWRALLEDGGVIIAREDVLQPTVAEQYMRIHFPDHYLLAINIVCDIYPYLAPFALRQFESDRGYINNMFVCSATFLDELCNWWFAALFRIEEHLSFPNDPYQKRVMAFLSERLLDIYLHWRFATGTPKQELPIFLLADNVFSSSNNGVGNAK